MSTVEVIKFSPSQVTTCDALLLVDSVLKSYCDFLIDTDLDNNEPLIKVETDLSPEPTRTPLLSTCKQLVLARSCLSDVLYAIQCLGLWCTKKTIKLYLTEFSRLLKNDHCPGDIISSTSTILNCLYSRSEKLISSFKDVIDPDLVLQSSRPQLKTLLKYIEEFRTPPNSTTPICIIHVRRKVIAKVIALWLNEVAKKFEQYSFIKSNYVVASSRKHRNRMAVDNFDLHHEAAIRDFRFGKCNTLVMSTMNERYADMLRSSLVISFDCPNNFSDFVRARTNCRSDSSKYVVIIDDRIGPNLDQQIVDFINIERFNNLPSKRDSLDPDEIDVMRSLELKFPPYPGSDSKSPATIWRSLSIINKYCSKLPSDSFTRLTPEWLVNECKNGDGEEHYYCQMRLPINSPVRQTIVGPMAPTKHIAIRLAAFTACKVLHRSSELDDNMQPIKKESIKSMTHKLSKNRGVRGRSIGSTKHRQYYKKRLAKVFSGERVAAGFQCFLYKFKMVLTCTIPDEQNRRGRRIIDPGETNRNYAIICTQMLPNISPFPVFTRSGEVMIYVELVSSEIEFTLEQIQNLRTFHQYTFSKVLRLDKYPTVYDPENSPFTIVLCPVVDVDDGKTVIDWDFVEKICKSNDDSQAPSVEQRKAFKFNNEDYIDAVVIPWYRLTDRQQFAYYVAEICNNMSPKSQFPDESSGFATFTDYYRAKYNLTIYNDQQPILDVDHTSARLNLLTPRYVNRKGRTLPSSTPKTRRESRESLVQKQLLIPELCTIHPFPASFWRKAVCLPCIFYRLNSLYLAEELRREVASEIKLGYVEPPKDFEWPSLNFGWSLKDVINNHRIEEDEPDQDPEFTDHLVREIPAKSTHTASVHFQQPIASDSDFVIDHFDPSQYDIPDIPLDAPPEDWMSIKLISSGKSGAEAVSGWDQPLEQRDLFLKANETTWSDCEGELSDSDDEAEPLGKMKEAPLDESDSSWSTSDEDIVDEEPGESVSFSDWQPKKIKNQPLVRELFVPIYELTTNDLPPYAQLKHPKESDSKTSQKSNIFETTLLKDSNGSPILAILNHLFGDESCNQIDDSQKTIAEWYDLLISLSARVDQVLSKNPELFRDNGVKLIAVDDSLGDYNVEMQPTFGELLPNRDTDCTWPCEDWKNIKFDPTRAELKSGGPGPNVILQALTMSNASDGINLERLETVGDSFLKYSITAYLYCMYKSMHEGKLSYLRSTEISNANLYYLGRSKHLGELMSATKFEPNDNWLAPGYTVADSTASKPDNKKQEIDRALAEVPYDLMRQHSIPDKSIADCVEALIGAYLTASGSRAALLFMRWLGLRVIPTDFDLEVDLQKGDNESEMWRWLDIPPSPLICASPSYDEQAPEYLPRPEPDDLKRLAIEELDRLYHEDNMQKFEEDIQYCFRDKAYLVQAFTHNSFHQNHVTDCHQRLEFLGDALLDYLITRYLFEDPRCHSPGTLTDLRSALVNNTFFASLAVKYKFHQYLKYVSDELYTVIDGFVKKFKFESRDTITKGYTLLICEGESEFAEDVEVPKALGDVFESVAGAIYLDSGMSLDQVWQVYFKMMKPEIEYFSNHVPKSPIRELLESMPQNVRFSPTELAPDRKHRVTAEVFGLGRFTGVGRNKHSAKSTAAKRALRILALKRKKEQEKKSQQTQEARQ